MSVTFTLGIKEGNVISWLEVDACDSEASKINVANANARMILGLIGVDTYELVGTLSVKQVRQMAEKVDDLANVKATREECGLRGAKIIDCGRSLDQVRGYACYLDKLADLAEKYEAFICYS